MGWGGGGGGGKGAESLCSGRLGAASVITQSPLVFGEFTRPGAQVKTILIPSARNKIPTDVINRINGDMDLEVDIRYLPHARWGPSAPKNTETRRAKEWANATDQNDIVP